mmetsp:Transcript_33931/g.53993  ORF Transcript_33931/g.53993 Transcript_33931/m.53993 type:complete len:375 (-) Transcript_33931:165-1289(-)
MSIVMPQPFLFFACLVFGHARQSHDRMPSSIQVEPREALSTVLLAQTPGAYVNRALFPISSLQAKTQSVPSSTSQRAASPAMVGTLGKVLALPTLYTLMSVNEYVTHRWYQHEEFNRDHALQRLCQRVAKLITGRPLFNKMGRRNTIKLKGGGHVEHHAETYDDMSLKKDPRWRATKAALSLNKDVFRGTAFSWPVTFWMTIQMLPTTLPVFALLGFTVLQTFAILLPGMLLHALVWNMLHPPMHGLPSVPISYGAPSSVLESLRSTAYFRYIYENHQGHHVLGGQKNYNVCCPLTDHLLGTYVPAKVWSKDMRAVPGPDDTERWGVPVEPEGVPQAPIIAKGKVTEADLKPTALKRDREPVTMQIRNETQDSA